MGLQLWLATYICPIYLVELSIKMVIPVYWMPRFRSPRERYLPDMPRHCPATNSLKSSTSAHSVTTCSSTTPKPSKAHSPASIHAGSPDWSGKFNSACFGLPFGCFSKPVVARWSSSSGPRLTTCPFQGPRRRLHLCRQARQAPRQVHRL